MTPAPSAIIRQGGTTGGDEHLIKLVEALVRQYARTSDPVLLVAADEPTVPPGPSPYTVLQLRLVVETDNFDEAVAFYRDSLGLPEEFYVESDGDARVMALQIGRATLEIVNPAQRRLIDDLEVGHQVSRNIRVAFEVTDIKAATARVVAAGAELIASPTRTPWNSLNSRLEAPAGLQITLFEELHDHS